MFGGGLLLLLMILIYADFEGEFKPVVVLGEGMMIMVGRLTVRVNLDHLPL